MNNKKLFIVVNVDWFFLSHRLPVALVAQEAGWDVTIVTADTGKLKDIEAKGLKVINLPMSRSGMNVFKELKTLNFLRKLYKREKPDVVHHVGMKTILFGTLAAKFSKVNGVVNAISGLGGFFAEDNKGFLSKMMPMVLRFSHNRPNLLCIFQNDHDWGVYVKHKIIKHEQGCFIKGSGVSLEEFCYTPEPEEGKIKVILTARMIVEKGIFLLTKAAERLRSKYDGTVEFLLIGGLDDHPGAITKEQLDVVCDGKYIQWLGFRSDVRDLLKKCHIVAFPSYYMEGLPKSLIEADAIGRPVITSNSVGCKEAVIDGYNGFLIQPKDVDMLTEKLDLLLSDKDLRVKMGVNSREYAEKYFDIEVVKERHLSIYNELVK
ncbi:glycosyltransferase family 4 protein [Bacteroides pyogenes]|uniref:glycosyltransferase family 4 protein n=1 Tax=Bacteroides pyogenes TaxID=310300 RepID=UPI001BAD8502|nr:glycosyltransferase family 4 protein [Bacteroides pyogenes]MBR8706872.1 N,N'-diacetylbacillosaminyl-diphospho-undecaprenol alpha-1,3-N-acetylgalactosaminyltransferase [Bacteroides pyogenes]